MKKLTFYTRKRCSLCDQAKAELALIRADHPFALEVIDLDSEASDEKRAAYDWEVPVVELDGRKVMKFRIDRDRLVRLLSS